MNELLQMILHTDDALLFLVSENVIKAYAVLFLIIMLETGNIFFPFLPGDGLLFSAGVIAAGSDLNILVLLPLLMIAATTGNLLNYATGSLLGTQLRKSKNRFVGKSLKALDRTELYYLKHGDRAIVIGRFFPIIRTFIPFFAGMVKMPFAIFFKYTLVGAVLWITIFLLLGYFLGEIEWVKNNYGLIFLSLVVLTLIPFLTTIFKRFFQKRNS